MSRGILAHLRSLLQELVGPQGIERLLAWVDQHPPDAIVGSAASSQFCPLSKWIKVEFDRAGFGPVFVQAGLGLIRVGLDETDMAAVVPAPWCEAVMKAVDGPGPFKLFTPRSVTFGEVRQIVEALRGTAVSSGPP